MENHDSVFGFLDQILSSREEVNKWPKWMRASTNYASASFQDLGQHAKANIFGKQGGDESPRESVLKNIVEGGE